MGLVNWTANSPGGQRFVPFFAQGSTTQGYIFPVQPAAINVANTSTHPVTFWIDHYASPTTYAGNVTHLQLQPNEARSFNWNPTDANWVGIGLNGDTLPAGVSTLQLNFADLAYCAHGTSPKASNATQIFITDVVIEAILAPLGAGWLAPLFSFLLYTTLDVPTLCAGLPPILPPIDLTLLTAGPAVIKQLLLALAWPLYCQCTAGTPTPTPPPVPAPVQPIGWPPPVTFTCTDTDVCATLVQIEQQLAALANTVGQIYPLLTAVQRYGVPFASVRGSRMVGLTGAGVVDVSATRIIGVLAEVTAMPAGLKEFSGVPEYISDLGWLSVLSSDGLIDEIRLTRQAMAWSSRLLPLAVQIGYFLREGVTADITPLLAEP